MPFASQMASVHTLVSQMPGLLSPESTAKMPQVTVTTLERAATQSSLRMGANHLPSAHKSEQKDELYAADVAFHTGTHSSHALRNRFGWLGG